MRGAVAEGCGGGGRGRPWGHATTGTGGLDLSRHHGHSPIRIEFNRATLAPQSKPLRRPWYVSEHAEEMAEIKKQLKVQMASSRT